MDLSTQDLVRDMSERIFIGVAWPYANGPLHLGHLAGALLPPDIFARYHRIKGNQVLMVSGSDQHGTPITVRAEREGKSPREIVDFYHQQFVENLADRRHQLRPLHPHHHREPLPRWSRTSSSGC